MRVSFSAESHTYRDVDTGEVLPNISFLLHRGGHVDDRWYTEESRARGREVHALTADYDLGTLADPKRLGPIYKAPVLAYVQAVGLIRPTWTHIEEALASDRYRFAGTPDRVGEVFGAHAVLEIKNGARERWHGIQTALQAVLAGEEVGLPVEAIRRYVLYLRPTGKWALEEYPSRQDVTEAYELIRRFCRRVA